MVASAFTRLGVEMAFKSHDEANRGGQLEPEADLKERDLILSDGQRSSESHGVSKARARIKSE
jgi:hypothetical protein